VCDGAIRLIATEGALVGPPWSKRQNGIVFEEIDGPRIYYEPHASHDLAALQRIGPVDVCIVPTSSAYAAGAFVTLPVDEDLRSFKLYKRSR
jgi:hypothetical protein